MREQRTGCVVTLHFDSAVPAEEDESFKLAELIDKALASGLKHFVVSLAGVESVKAIDLGVLKGRTEKCRELGGELVVCRVQSEQVRRVFKLSGLDEFLTIRVSEADAAEYLDGRP